jgi:hypothetical protein
MDDKVIPIFKTCTKPIVSGSIFVYKNYFFVASEAIKLPDRNDSLITVYKIISTLIHKDYAAEQKFVGRVLESEIFEEQSNLLDMWIALYEK